MSDDPKTPLTDPPLPPEDTPSAVEPEPTEPAAEPAAAPPAPEEVPDWLQRIRAKRARELKRRPPEEPTLFDPYPVHKPEPEPEPEPVPPAAPASEEDALPPGIVDDPGVGAEMPEWLRTIDSEPFKQTEPPPWLRTALEEQPEEPEPAPEPAPVESAPASRAHGIAPDTSAPAISDREARRQALKEQREQRRREKQKQGGSALSAFRSIIVVGAAAVLIATIFTFWTPVSFLSDETREGLRPAYATLSAQSPPTPVPTPLWMRRVGVVSGHWGPHPSTGRSDPGAVCRDGLTEAEVNRNVAQLVVQFMSGRGYDVDLLDEWDPRLENYEASALISLHADSCYAFEEGGATGFKVAPPSARTSARADDLRLRDCVIEEYGKATNLPLHPSITQDMTEYHSFREIAPITPGVIIELGFLFEDRDIMTGQPDLLAEGIVNGLICFLEAGPPTPLPELTPWPTAESTPTPLSNPGLS